MASFSGLMARKGWALALAASTMAAVTSPVQAGNFSQKECKGIGGIAVAVVRHIGADTLGMEFRQSFRNWLGADMRCDGPKEIAIVTTEDSATYGTIRSELLSLPKPMSLEKAGLKAVVVKSSTAAPPLPQKRTEAVPAPSVN